MSPSSTPQRARLREDEAVGGPSAAPAGPSRLIATSLATRAGEPRPPPPVPPAMPAPAPEEVPPHAPRPLHALGPADLARCAVWEPCAPGPLGEPLVRPRPDLALLPPDAGADWVVRARFTAADGSRFVGYCSPPPPRPHLAGGSVRPELLHPVVVHAGRQVDFWLGTMRPRAVELEARYRTLATSAERLFPLRFSPDVPLPGLEGEGVLHAFEGARGEGEGLLRVRWR